MPTTTTKKTAAAKTTKKVVTEKVAKVEKVEKAEKEVVKPVAPKGKYYYANGKRKTSIARVKMYEGTGTITINDKPAAEYLTVKTLMGIVKSPLKLVGAADKFSIVVKVDGGGVHSQADAIRHGIARALIIMDPFNKPTLKKAGMLTRDSRVKERKKFGLKRARKAPQFSKR